MLIFVYMRIGELANRTGLTVGTIRYYESIKLIPKPKTSESGYRFYTKDYISILNFIRVAKTSGFSLREIRLLFKLDKCTEVNKFVRKKLDEITYKIKLYEGIKVKLNKLLKTCPNSGRLGNCTILESFYKTKV